MVVSPDELISGFRALLGERETEDEAITFIENLSDTLNEKSNPGYTEDDIKKAVDENDQMWRKKYVERFTSNFSDESEPDTLENEEDREEEDLEDTGENVTIDDLFEEKED